MDREHWRRLRGSRRFYLVSDRGRVKSLYGKGRILKPSLNHRGKEVVCLSWNGETETVTTANLVKDAFGDKDNGEKTKG